VINIRLMVVAFFTACVPGIQVESLTLGATTADDLGGVDVRFADYSGPATLSARTTGRFTIRIDVDPHTEEQAMTVQVALPISGRNTWPINDVEVRDSHGSPVSVRRAGIEWHKLFISVLPQPSSFVVHAVPAKDDSQQFRPERGRAAADPATGLSATISKWYDGRRTALSFRFDDSHPTHLSTVIPVLNEYGFRGTFMVNPGGHLPDSRRRSAFESHRTEWEAIAKYGRHEFANHTLNHRGAQDDESMDHEIGQAAKAIWKLTPGSSKLTALNLGGGTYWVTTKTLRHYLDKYYLFDASFNSTGMDDVYGNRVATFRRLLESHMETGVRYKVHYHDVGEGHGASEANFRAALDVAREHQDQLWIAGMADIHKYETERRAASLRMSHRTDNKVLLEVSCSTDHALYDQPLTITLTLPESWTAQHVVVTDETTTAIDRRIASASGKAVLRFDVPPTDAVYSIENHN
jgi:peptidoglycan/xylan/chitin deacetylase (PgdA/CDA1 family)